MSEPNNPGSGSSPTGRRKSIVEMFAPRSASYSPTSSSPGANATASTPQPVPGHRRGMSMATLGLTGSAPGQSSPFDAFARQRRASISTSSASGSPEFRNSFDDSAVIEEDDASRPPLNSPPSPSFARRLSFGAQALRDVRQGGGQAVNNNGGGGRQPSSSLSTLNEDSDQVPASARRSPGTAKATGEGFNWSEAMRDKTKRTGSVSGSNPFAGTLNRTRSVNSNNPEPPKELPKPAPTPQKMKKPDHLGERMLRGDFMMD